MCWYQVRINPVVKYDWEQRRYIGRLVAVHLNHTHVAYALRGIGELTEIVTTLTIYIYYKNKIRYINSTCLEA